MGWQSSSWNFSDAGHEKGPADGIGGVVKRTADDAVAHGRSMTSKTGILHIARERNLNVQMFEVTSDDIETIEVSPTQNKGCKKHNAPA